MPPETLHAASTEEPVVHLRKSSSTEINASLKSHAGNPVEDILLHHDKPDFRNQNLSGFDFTKVRINCFAIDFFNANLSQASFAGKNITKTSFAHANCSHTNFSHVIFFSINMDETNIHGAAFFGAIAKEYDNDQNVIASMLANCIVSSPDYEPPIHFSALDQEVKHWILISRTDYRETLRALMQEYTQETSGFRAFFSHEGRIEKNHSLKIKAFLSSHPDSSFPEFLEFLNRAGVTTNRSSALFKRLEFINDWYDLKVNNLLEKLVQSSEAVHANTSSIPSLVKMAVVELFQVLVDKIRGLFMLEPDEE